MRFQRAPVIVVLCLLPAVSFADTAEEYNDRGKALFKEQRYQEAHDQFVLAVQTEPLGKYYFNVCYTLSYLNRIREAIDACEQVAPNLADQALIEKSEAVLADLRKKLPPEDNTKPVDTPPGPGPAPTAPPQPTVITQAPPAASSYEWSLGGSINGLANQGLGDAALYSDSGNAIGISAKFMTMKERRVGFQARFAWNSIPENSSAVDTLRVYDLGGGIFWSRPLGNRLVFEPLAGAHLAFLQPDSSSSQVLVSIGIRAEAPIGFVFGPKKQHVVSVIPALNLYTAALAGGADEIRAADFGLDQGGTTFGIGIGYQYRFSQPFGSIPLFRLE